MNAPLGSAISETLNGGTIARRAFSSMSAATMASRPPMKMPVRSRPFGLRENTASWVSAATPSGAMSQYGTTIW